MGDGGSPSRQTLAAVIIRPLLDKDFSPVSFHDDCDCAVPFSMSPFRLVLTHRHQLAVPTMRFHNNGEGARIHILENRGAAMMGAEAEI